LGVCIGDVVCGFGGAPHKLWDAVTTRSTSGLSASCSALPKVNSTPYLCPAARADSALLVLNARSS
jgi:hypothetical protein